jgi:hypothetical protein
VSLVYGVAWRILKSLEGVGELAYTHALTGVLLLTISLCLLLQGDTLLISLAAEALVLHLVARRLADGVLRAAGHILFVIVGGWLLQRLLDAPAGDMAVANAPALTDLGVIAVAIVVAKVALPTTGSVPLPIWMPMQRYLRTARASPSTPGAMAMVRST